jgi:diguanylate cyclase (GGDEF)-like protein
LSDYDGILYVSTTVKEGSIKDQVREWILASGKPCVTLEEELPGISSVGFDQRAAMWKLVDHLVQEHDCQRFGFLCGPEASSEANDRKNAVIECVEASGRSIDRAWILPGRYQFDDGVAYGERLLEKYQQNEDLPDAVLCANDLMAIGLVETIRNTPLYGSIAVTGFDRYLEGEIYYPSLTTVARPRETVAYEGIKLLRELVETGVTTPVHRNLDYRIFIGQSCGCRRRDLFDNGAFRNETFSRMRGEEVLSTNLNAMEELISSEISIERIMQAIAVFLENIGATSGQVYLREDFFSETDNDYQSCKHLALDWKSKQAHSTELQVVMPLHYQKHRMGYCVVTGVGALFRNGVLENFFRTVCYALENCMQRLRYESVNQKLQHLYRIDQLTEIYNRFGLEDAGQQLYHRNCMAHSNTVFIFCDINRLKYINDTYGHEAGDWVIQTTGKALAKLESPESLPFRIGGDEFIVLTTEGSGVDEAVIRQKITEAAKDAPVEGMIEVSIGVVVAPWNEPEDLDHYLSRADEAMYEEKKRFHERYAKQFGKEHG